MAQAPNYVPTTGFATDETNQAAGRSTVKTVSIDTEFANISTSVNTINTNLQKLQRDDGKFKDGLIEPYALAEQTRALIASGGKPKGSWLSGQNYEVGDAVQYISTSYLCVVAHTSTVSFASGLWMAISGDGSSFLSAAESALSALNAASSASSATTSASAALVSANSATASASAASNSATAAGNSATSAAASALTAQSIISNNINGATQAEAEAGTDNAKYMSALRVKESIVYNVPPAFPATTRMSFNQSSAPSGWTKDTTPALNDSIMRIVVGTVGSGGSTAFSTFNGQTATAAYTLAIADIPSHSHTQVGNGGSGGYNTAKTGGTFSAANTGSTGGGGAHSHGITTAIKYNDFIIASKN